MLTEDTFAVNDVAVAPGATVTLVGTVTAELLLVNVTASPPEAATELSETVHVVELAPVNELPPQENALMEGAKGDATPLRLMVVVSEAVPCVAVSVTVCEVVTLDTFAAKVALVAPVGTNTTAGTVTEPLLLAKLTMMPLLGADAVKVTLQESALVPIIDEFAQLKPAKEATDEADPLPCSFTDPQTFTFLLVIAFTLSSPVESVADPGS